MIAEEVQAAGLVGRGEPLQEQPAEQAREHAHRQEEAGPARDPALVPSSEMPPPGTIMWTCG